MLKRKPILFFVLLFVWFSLIGVQSFAQDSYEIEAKGGKLTLQRSHEQLFQVKFNNNVLFESEVEYGSIYAQFPKKKPSLIVLRIGEQALACAGYMYIIDASKAKPTITKAFGNCNIAPKVVFQNQTLTIRFPDGSKISADDSGAHRYGAAETWRYRHGKLKKLK